MEGEEGKSDDERAFVNKSIPKRMAIIVAGGAVNIVFGLLVYFILATSTGTYTTMIVETVTDGYNAQTVGIIPGDEIIKIDGKRVRLKSDFNKAITKSNGNEINITIKRNEELLELKIVPTEKIEKNIGVYFGAVGEELSSEIKSIYQNSAAERAGLQAKDRILKVNGIDTENNPYKVIEYTDSAVDNQVIYTIERDGKIFDVTLEPEKVSKYYLGVTFGKSGDDLGEKIYFGYWDTIEFSLSIVDNLKQLFSGNVGVDQLMGPIGISSIVAETKGIVDFVYLLALISLSLGITNLLPFPPLDGGKFVLLLIEAIRRKPLKEEIEMNIQSIGFILMILLSIYVAYNDVLRIF